MKCLEPGCNGHPCVTLERNATYTVRCKVCNRYVQGHPTEEGAMKAFYYKYQKDGWSPEEASAWRAKSLGLAINEKSRQMGFSEQVAGQILKELDIPEPAA